jgi:type III restriction enzyme
MNTLNEDYNAISRLDLLEKTIPIYIKDNINHRFELRHYQIEAISRLIHYFERYSNKTNPSQLLFHMATGCGKTLLMGTSILYLYHLGYHNFLFIVNNKNIIEKTRDNFLNHHSSKSVFTEKIKFNDKSVNIVEVSNFETSYREDISIIFTTIQGLHSFLNRPRENAITYEDFINQNIVILSDEAHHINAWTKNKLNKQEQLEKDTWEQSINKIFYSNTKNIMLEFTATIDLNNSSVYEKYKDKIIYEYSLKQFRQDGYSKELKVLEADLENIDRMLQAVILSQYRRKIAEKSNINLKPVILFKSKTIKNSEDNAYAFRFKIDNLSIEDIQNIKEQNTNGIINKAFDYFDEEKITIENLVSELKYDFSSERSMILDSQNIDPKRQIILNTLEEEDNETRAIFAVDMLNEGWDVLNLFDIVRLYNTRSESSTNNEAQLIGRGARYFPFQVSEDQPRYMRKFDSDLDSHLRIIEELYYHSSHNPKYIQELKTVLRNTGILPNREPKVIQLKVKDKIKNTDFWKNSYLFYNQRIKAPGLKIEQIDTDKIYGPVNLKTGFTREELIFESNEKSKSADEITRQIELKDFNEIIIDKALTMLDFYQFQNIKKYFKDLKSINEIKTFIKIIKVDLRSSRYRIENLNRQDMLYIVLKILSQLEKEIREVLNQYKGTELFIHNRIKDIVVDKTMNINVGENSDREFGIAMSETTKVNLQLDLPKKDWYVYHDDYGTSEEKYFIQFLNGVIDKLKTKYYEIFLVRNANLFKIFRFQDGKAIEPDFVLFLKEKDNEALIQYQLYIEAKGSQLLKTDEWKEEFLKNIEGNYKIQILAENEKFKLIGLPFYNEASKYKFINEVNRKLDLDVDIGSHPSLEDFFG